MVCTSIESSFMIRENNGGEETGGEALREETGAMLLVQERLGWCIVAMAAIFSLGILPLWKTRIYPQGPGLAVRMAVPALLMILALACFAGYGHWAMIIVILAGARQIYTLRVIR